MLKYDPHFSDSVRFHSYEPPYYVFVLDNLDNEVVIYDPRKSTVVFRRSFCRLGFTSMVTNKADVYLGLTTGDILKLEEDSKSHRYHERLHNKRTGSSGEPVAVLGINDLVMFTGAQCRRSRDWQEWEIVNVTFRGKLDYKYSLNGVLECHRFSRERQQLIMVVKSDTQRSLCIISIMESGGLYIPVPRTYNLLNWFAGCPTLIASAVSSKGDIALRDRGLLRIVNPVTDRRPKGNKGKEQESEAPLFVDNVLKNDQGGQACFVGAEDEYLIYCENWSSKIAVAQCTEHGWKEEAPWHFDTGSIFNVRHRGRTYSNIHNPGWDGEKFVVRVGPDGFPGNMGGEEMPNMLLALDVNHFAQSKPPILTHVLTKSRQQDRR